MTAAVQKVLVFCSTAPREPRSHREQLIGLLKSLPQIDSLVPAAAREGVTGLLYRHLRTFGVLDRLGDRISKKLETEYHRIAADNLRLQHDVKIILEVLHHHALPATVLQGMAMLDRYSDVGLRPMNDIDLWIRAKDLSRIHHLLTQLGYRQDDLYRGSYRKGTTKLDLRTHLLWADRLHARKHLLRVDQTDLFEASTGFHIDGCPARRLQPYDEMIYLTMHALKHFAGCLIWLVDLRLLTADWMEADWRQCQLRAENLGQPRIISCAVFLLRDLFGSSTVTSRFDPAGLPKLNSLQKYLLKTRKKSGALPQWAPLFLFETNGGLINRLTYQAEHIFPRPEVLRQVFPNHRSGGLWLLYSMRFLQLYGKAIRSLSGR